jgi:hypothetical protein
MRGCLQPGQPHEQPMSWSSRWAKIAVTQDTAIFFFGVMTQARRKSNKAHTYIHEQHNTTYIHEQHSTYLHSRTTQHIPASTNNTAQTNIHEQHNTYPHPRTTQHIPTSTNNTAHTYIHEQHSTHSSTNNTTHTHIHEKHSTYLDPRTTHNFFREFRSGRVRRELIWTESWKLFSQELEFLQRTQNVSINFILYCTPQFFSVLWFFKRNFYKFHVNCGFT